MANFDENDNYIKTVWQTGDTITSAKLNKIEESMEYVHASTNTRIDDLRDRFTGLHILNIMDYGAKCDGVTDDTEAFRSALETAYVNGGVHLFVPKGEYVIDGYSDIYSNTYIEFERGATILKTKNSTTQYVFVCGRIEDRGTTGYGGGAKNVMIKNGTFIGYPDKNIAISFTFNHMENFVMENCSFKYAVTNGHVLDLAGCKDIYVRNCRFEGMKECSGREFSEVFQVDNSTPESLSNNFSNYDYIATKNVYIEGCSFTPIYDSSNEILYPCPNVFGSHNFYPGYYFENINFIHNYVENYQRIGSGHTGGCIRFYSVKGLNIMGNCFRTTKNLNGYIITAQSKAVNDVYQTCSDINIIDNIIDGYRYDGSGVYSLIRIYGINDLYCERITIRDNRFIRCHTGVDVSTAKCPDVISLDLVKDAEILNNYLFETKRLLYAENTTNLLIHGNDLRDSYYIPITLNTSNNISITNNILDHVGSILYMNDVNHFVFNSNVVRDAEGYLAPTYVALCCYKNCYNGVVSNNIIDLKSDGTYDSGLYGYSTYGTSKNISFSNNITIGLTAYGDSVYIGADTANVSKDVISSTKYE